MRCSSYRLFRNIFGTCLIVVTTKLLVVVINLHARPPPGAPNHVVTNYRRWLMASCSSKVLASKHYNSYVPNPR